MRHYQRAKRMVGERRYDEALSLYHSALQYDADNVHLRYDVGQLFERLQQYALLTNRLLCRSVFSSHKPTSSSGS